MVGAEGEDHAQETFATSFQKSVGCFSDDYPFTLQETEKPQCRIEVKLKSVMVHVYNGSEV